VSSHLHSARRTTEGLRAAASFLCGLSFWIGMAATTENCGDDWGSTWGPYCWIPLAAGGAAGSFGPFRNVILGPVYTTMGYVAAGLVWCGMCLSVSEPLAILFGYGLLMLPIVIAAPAGLLSCGLWTCIHGQSRRPAD